MAKLPGFETLGPASIGGGRAVGKPDVSGIGRAGAALAAGGQALGKGIAEVGSDIADIRRKQVEETAFDAHAGAATELLNLHSELQKSNDYGNMDAQYQKGARDIVDKWGEAIPEGRLRNHYFATQDEAVARGAASVSQMAFHKAGQADADSRKAALMDLEAKIGQDPANPILPDGLKTLGLRVDKAVDKGWISKEQGDLEKRNVAVQTSFRRNETEGERDPVGWLASKGLAPRQSRAMQLAGLSQAATDNGISPEAAARYIQIESGGNPNARTGSYYGLTQISAPEFAKYNKIPGASIMDPEANMRAGFAKMRAEGEMFANATGKQPSDFDRYMIHQQGLAGYQAHLANPNAPAWQNMRGTGEGNAIAAGQQRYKGMTGPAAADQWAHDAIWGNISDARKRQFGNVDNVTSAAFLNMWSGKYGSADGGGDGGGPAKEDDTGWHMLDPLTRMRLVTQARSRVQQLATDQVSRDNLAINQRTQEYERLLIDASGGRGAMPPREMIEQDPLLAGNEAHRNTLLRQWDVANKKDDSLQAAWLRFQNPENGPFQPFDKDDKENLDKIYQNLVNGDPEKEIPALQAVVDRAGIVPDSAAKVMRGAMVSGNAGRVLATAQMARNLMGPNPQIFAGVTGGSELAAAGVDYKHYTENFGFTPQEAAEQIIKDNSPEYKAEVAKIKDEDVTKIVKDKLSISDMEAEFNEGYRLLGSARPTIEFNEGAKAAAYQDYAELFRMKYKETGDVERAKSQAIAQMKNVWGVTRFNGMRGGNVMRFAPENAPAYQGIPDVADRMADQAIAAIKAFTAPSGPGLEANAPTGETITRDKIILTPTPGGQTAAAYFSGRPVPYLLSWLDKDGAPHFLNPGKAFVFDGQAEREKISAERQTKSEAGVAQSKADEAFRERAFGVSRRSGAMLGPTDNTPSPEPKPTDLGAQLP